VFVYLDRLRFLLLRVSVPSGGHILAFSAFGISGAAGGWI
jgi:hypothetical protein